MLPGFCGGVPSGKCLERASSGLGSLGSEEEEAARLRQVGANLQENYEQIQATYGPGIKAVVNVAQAIDSGDAENIQRSFVQAAATVATMFGPVGAIMGSVLMVFQGLVDWLVSTWPAVGIDCFWDGQHLTHACRMYKGSDSEASMSETYKSEGRFWLGTTMSRSNTWGPHSISRNSENLPKWSDPPMVPAAGHMEGDAFYYDLVNLDGGSLEDKKAKLIDFCTPRRAFASSTPPLATGYRSWQQYMRDHQDQGGSDAARTIGREVLARLLRDGDPRYFAGSDGSHCWHGGFLVKCTGFTDATLVRLIRMLIDTQGPAADVAAAAGIVVPEASRGEGYMYWEDGLAYSVFHFIRMSRYAAYHMKALLDEYNRRGLGSHVAATGLRPTVTIKPAGTKTTKKPMGTVAKVAIGGGIVAAVAGALKLLKVW